MIMLGAPYSSAVSVDGTLLQRIRQTADVRYKIAVFVLSCAAAQHRVFRAYRVEIESTRAASSVCSLPPCGGGRAGEGVGAVVQAASAK
jgi:hypothetical protein